MKSPKDKLKRIGPLIKSRKRELESETSLLNNLKALKIKKIEELRENQRKYMSGVDQLNQDRSKGKIHSTTALGQSLDFVKEKWQQNLKQVHEIEKEEKMQLSKVLDAQRDLKSMEALEERYIGLIKQEEAVRQQKEQDELATRNFKRQD